jgi:hypothetical protein
MRGIMKTTNGKDLGLLLRFLHDTFLETFIESEEAYEDGVKIEAYAKMHDMDKLEALTHAYRLHYCNAKGEMPFQLVVDDLCSALEFGYLKGLIDGRKNNV